MAARFVEVPADALMRDLRAIGDAVRAKGGGFVEGVQGREIIVDISPPGGRCMVRVYTSLARGADAARGCGEDAVRIVVCTTSATGTHVLEPSQKILRTAPAKMPEHERVVTFLARLRDRVRDAYRHAAKRPSCPSCGRAMARRLTRDKSREFFGCIGYPTCKGTLPATEGA